MPLKDRDRTRARRLVRLGIIRLGHKETKTYQNGRTVEYPVQDDHFVLTDAPEIAKVYGDEPRELDVMLPFPDIARNFDGAYTVWANGVLCCKGDGESVEYAGPMRTEVKTKNSKSRTSVYNIEGETLVMAGEACTSFDWNGTHFDAGDTVPCPGADANLYPHCAACRASAVLKVMMSKPELFRLGYYQVATGSGRNYDTILGTLDLISGDGARPVNGIPFKLRMVQEPTTYIEDGKRHKTTKWFLQLEPDPTFTRQLYTMQAKSLITAPQVARPALPEPVVDAEYIDNGAEIPPPFAEDGGPATGDWDAEDVDAEIVEDPQEKKPVSDTSAPAGPKALKRWGEIWRQGKKLGITGDLVEVIQGDITVNALTARAEALKAAIAQREADLAAQQDELF